MHVRLLYRWDPAANPFQWALSRKLPGSCTTTHASDMLFSSFSPATGLTCPCLAAGHRNCQRHCVPPLQGPGPCGFERQQHHAQVRGARAQSRGQSSYKRVLRRWSFTSCHLQFSPAHLCCLQVCVCFRQSLPPDPPPPPSLCSTQPVCRGRARLCGHGGRLWAGPPPGPALLHLHRHLR